MRPLTILEITEALAVKDDGLLVDEPPDDIDEEYVNSKIVELCASVVEVQRAKNLSSMTVHLAHFQSNSISLSANTHPDYRT